MRKNLRRFWNCRLVLIAAALLSLAMAPFPAIDVTLQWDVNTEPNLAGYRIYYKMDSSGEPYDGIEANEGTSPITVALEDLDDPYNPQYTLTGLLDGTTYFFVVTAYNTGGLESGYSDEVSTGQYE